MPDAKSTPITRSWSTTLAYLVGGIACLALSVILFMTIASGPVTIGIALIPAILALILLGMSLSGAGTAACPACGGQLSGLSTSTNDGVNCPQCHGYFEGTNGTLHATDPGRIADTPTFTSPLPEQFSFPEGCCVCGKPATHREKVSMESMNASSAVTANAIPGVGFTSHTRTTVEVPHCDDHKDGASLTGTPKNPNIRFRSYPYLRAFCELNKTTPGYGHNSQETPAPSSTPVT